MNGYDFDPGLVDAFVAGTLDQPGEDALAGQVARVIPCHWAAPNPIVSALDKLRRTLGGDPQLLQWLERHPGPPRMVARIYAAMGLLDRYGDSRAVATALRELRERSGDPPGLKGYLIPVTDEATLLSLSGTIELMLCDGEVHRAIDVALAAATMLRQVAPRARELDAGTQELDALAEQATNILADA